MNLVVDIGNTRFKYAFFDEKGIGRVGYEPESMFLELESNRKNTDIFLSGSGKITEEFRNRLKRMARFWLECDPRPFLPLQIAYATPETLGFDRLAVCVGARHLFPERHLLVIDSGTAITYNYVDAKGIFLGGNISPGQEIRFRSLHLFTEKLPYVPPEIEYGGRGNGTETAILNGVMNGILFEIKGYIEEFGSFQEDRQVVLTGGNSSYLSGKLPPEIYFEKYLGFIGLNEILEYNKNHN